MSLTLFTRLAFAAGCLTAPAAAQRYELANGRFLDAGRVSLRGGVLVEVVKVGDGAGVVERAHAVTDVVRLDWPEPVELVEARGRLAQGEPAGALEPLAAVRRQFAPFARIPGSWWTEASRLLLRALDRENAGEEAAKVARELTALATDPEAVGEARLALTEQEIRAGRVRLAQAMLEEVLAGPAEAPIRARAWLLRGDIALAHRQYEHAIEAYLRIPVFHSAHAELVPSALAAAEKAFRAYGDEAQADRMATELRRFGDALRTMPPPAQESKTDLSEAP